MCFAQLEKDSQLSYLGFYELPKVTPKSLISLLCIEFIFIYDTVNVPESLEMFVR